jgi:hypothetical protein
MFAGCGGSKVKTFTGVLDSWDEGTLSVTIDGKIYKVAAGMETFASQAEAGKTYEFTTDEFGSIIKVIPK